MGTSQKMKQQVCGRQQALTDTTTLAPPAQRASSAAPNCSPARRSAGASSLQQKHKPHG